MEPSTRFQLAADAILLLHVLFVSFVVIGLLLIFAGNARGWSWVRNPGFRVTHILAISIIVIQSWLGVICPLTRFEMALRSQAGDTVYTGSFIAHWLESILYYRAPPWVFIVCYTVFAALVAGSWFWVRPRPFTNRKNHRAS
jgi:hypothetical protein